MYVGSALTAWPIKAAMANLEIGVDFMYIIYVSDVAFRKSGGVNSLTRTHAGVNGSVGWASAEAATESVLGRWCVTLKVP